MFYVFVSMLRLIRLLLVIKVKKALWDIAKELLRQNFAEAYCGSSLSAVL